LAEYFCFGKDLEMRFIRKYSGFLMPIGIVLVAVLLFVPTILAGRSIRKNIEASKAQGQKITSMQKNTPSRAQADVEKLYQSEHKKDADEVVQFVRRSSQRKLISYNIFPEPKDTSQQVFVQFGAQYRTAIEELIKSMNALDAPSDIDIRKELETDVEGISAMSDPFDMFGSARSGGTQKDSSNAIVDAVCNKRAGSILLYGNPNSFLWYGYWADFKYSGLDAALKDCWHSQVAYWIYEDVVATINAMNTKSDCVYNSPVKRLVGVSFSNSIVYPNTTFMRSSTSTYSSSVLDEPDYIIDNGPWVLSAYPWTGRICDDDIDVVHFMVSVILDSKSFMSFTKELCTEKSHTYREGYSASGPEMVSKHNQITVLQSTIESVNRTAQEHAFYRYGDSAVVQLSLICEYIFNRSGYDRIKPEPVKELLGQSAEKTDTSAYGSTGYPSVSGGTRKPSSPSGTRGDDSGSRTQQGDPFDF